jgi:hypothetical protein
MLLAQTVADVLSSLVLEEVRRAFGEPAPMKKEKKMNTTKNESLGAAVGVETRTVTARNMSIALNALEKIANLPENQKLRSWKGREAVRIAKEAMEAIARG